MQNLINFINTIKFNNLKIFIIWFFILAGVNINVSHYIFSQEFDFIKYLYSIRLYTQFFIFLVLFYLNLKYWEKIKSVNLFFYLFLLYNIIQIISLILSENSNLNLVYNISSINLLLILNLIFYKETKEINKVFFFFITILFIIYGWFYLEKIFRLLFENKIFYGHYDKSLLLPSIIAPRTSGIGRMALILVIFSLIYFNFNTIKQKLFLSIFIVPGIFMTQSRLIVGIYLLFLCVISLSKFFNYKNLQLNNLKFIFIYLLIIPLLFSFAISQLKQSNIKHIKEVVAESFKEKELEKKQHYQDRIMIIAELQFKSSHYHSNYSTYKIVRKIDPKSFTSFRLRDWNSLIIGTKDNLFIGNGTQSDRFLINQSASNAALYFFSSAGLIGFSLFLLLWMYIILNIFRKKNYLKNDLNENNTFTFSIFLMFVFFLRSIFESSYAVFGIDQILFVISSYVICYEKRA